MSSAPQRVVLITGSRHAIRADFLDVIHGALLDLDIRNSDVFIHGAAKGVDSLAADYLKSSAPWPTVVSMHAQWEQHGRSAGPRRNVQMLCVIRAMSECGYQPFLIAFPGCESKGTRHMIRIWEQAGLATPLIFELPKDDQ